MMHFTLFVRLPACCVLFIVFFFQVLPGYGQNTSDTTYWRKHFRGGFNFNQASFSDNWQGGGVNSIGLNTFVSYKVNYAKGIHSWDNEIDLAYGIIKNEGQESRKSVDRIYLDTKYGRELTEQWSFFTSLSFLSQFDEGYEYNVEDPVTGETTDVLISNFFSPAFITSSWGMEYHPVEYFSVRLGPFSPRVTIVVDDDVAVNGEIDGKPARYGVPVGKTTRFEWLAFQMVADFNKDIAENLNLKWKYQLFANYQELEVKKIDHRLDASLTAKVNRFIDVAIGGILIYDYDQVEDVQISQTLNLGLVYRFKNYKE